MLEAIILLVVVGVICYLVYTYVPMPAPFKTVLTVIFVILAIVILLRALGLSTGGLHL